MTFRQFIEHGTQKRHTSLPLGGGQTAGRAGQSQCTPEKAVTRMPKWKPDIPETNPVKNPHRDVGRPMKPFKPFRPIRYRIDGVVA